MPFLPQYNKFMTLMWGIKKNRSFLGSFSPVIFERNKHWTTMSSFECHSLGFPRWLSWERITCSEGDTGDAGSFYGWGRSLEEDMATHSSIFAWRIPRTEKSGRPIGSRRAGHDWSHWAHVHIMGLNRQAVSMWSRQLAFEILSWTSHTQQLLTSIPANLISDPH